MVDRVSKLAMQLIEHRRQRHWHRAQKMMLDGLQRFMQGMMALVDTIPQYHAPEILPNGDIVIRRVVKDGAPKTQ